MDGSLLGFPDAFLVALISAPKADATSLAAFSNICCNKHNNVETKAEENVTFFQCKATLTAAMKHTHRKLGGFSTRDSNTGETYWPYCSLPHPKLKIRRHCRY